MASSGSDASTDIVICSPVRTPVGRMGGVLSTVPVTRLATDLLRTLTERTGLGEGDIDDVILGQGYAGGESPALGRIAALDAGLGVGVPGMQIDRRCGSGLQAILTGASAVATGGARLVVAGGAESMSNVEHYALGLRSGIKQGGVELMDRLDRGRLTAGGETHPVPGGMIETAENLRATYRITRDEQDELAARSHRRAIAAQEEGRFSDELVPVTIPGRRGRPDTVVDRDEHPRSDASVESLGALRPIRLKTDAESTVTAGNASGQNDGAAMAVVTTRAEAERRGLEPQLALRSWAVTGCEPEVMGIGPVGATAAALDRAGLTLDEIDLIELNEAFAAQVLACLAEWKVDPTDERLNPNGSGISLGHPIGATGARILATAAYEARRRDARYVLETMCIGGGQGLAAIFEATR
ncbi:acetyl-CoA C-acetyltransferase [Gordonia sp. 'Campus']|uniref:acetyl-CoA C-acetyltransferase n=1 Tax=Gordonia sp. 'Campus' TaxID=2915824 RepID=UPI001EE4E447|nr:acetyl-CoA C-acetyltransferase [Gordonia sp. 'Campus']